MSAFYNKVLAIRKLGRPLKKANPATQIDTPVKKNAKKKKARQETAVSENDEGTSRDT